MKVIFLDIDGVLNTPSSESRCGEYIGIDDEKVKKLKKIVEKNESGNRAYLHVEEVLAKRREVKAASRLFRDLSRRKTCETGA